MARAGRKPSLNSKRRQTTRAAQGRNREDGGTPELRARKLKSTRRTDLPLEPLAVLYGHGKIDETEYRAGLRLEKARRALYGEDTAPAREAYGERLVRGSAGQWAARQAAPDPVDEEAERREKRVALEYERLLGVLIGCGPAVASATLGIATRPYTSAWLATSLMEPGRWRRRHDLRLALIRDGLAAIDSIGSRPL